MSAIAQDVQQPQNLGGKIDAYFELRERKRELETETKAIDEQMKALEAELMSEMDQQGLRLARGRVASISIAESLIPEVLDWDQVHEYIRKNDALHLLEHRVSIPAWRELHESGEPVPGTAPFTRRKASVRKI